MKKIFLISIVLLAVCFIFVQAVPVVSNAVECVGDNCIRNPLKVNSIQEFISTALKFVVNLLAIAGVVYIMWTGLMFVMAQGNPEELKKAKQSFLNAIIGMAIILGAWAIATVIANTINKITNNNDVTLRRQN